MGRSFSEEASDEGEKVLATFLSLWWWLNRTDLFSLWTKGDKCFWNWIKNCSCPACFQSWGRSKPLKKSLPRKLLLPLFEMVSLSPVFFLKMGTEILLWWQETYLSTAGEGLLFLLLLWRFLWWGFDLEGSVVYSVDRCQVGTPIQVFELHLTVFVKSTQLGSALWKSGIGIEKLF